MYLRKSELHIQQVHYHFQLVPIELVIKSTRKWTQSTVQRQIIYNYLFMMSTSKIQKVSETFGFDITFKSNHPFSTSLFEINWFPFTLGRYVIGIVNDLKKRTDTTIPTFSRSVFKAQTDFWASILKSLKPNSYLRTCTVQSDAFAVKNRAFEGPQLGHCYLLARSIMDVSSLAEKLACFGPIF